MSKAAQSFPHSTFQLGAFILYFLSHPLIVSAWAPCENTVPVATTQIQESFARSKRVELTVFLVATRARSRIILKLEAFSQGACLNVNPGALLFEIKMIE